MDQWFVLDLGDGIVAWETLGRIESLFLAHSAGGEQSGARAVFTRHDSDGRLHCQVMAFFSPAAGDIARRFGARRCGRPPSADLNLLAGSEESWFALFPERAS